MTRLRGRLDHLLEPRVDGGLERLDADVRSALRQGAYELLYLDRVPAYAARSQAVALAREAAGRGAAGLVHAVLSRLEADAGGDGALPAAGFPSFDEDPAGHLSSWGSHPRWLVERWLRRWPPAVVRALVEANNRRPRIVVQPLRHSADEAVRLLVEEGIEAEPVGAGLPGIVLSAGGDARRALEVVPAVVQDPAAAMAALFVAPDAGMKVADLCAAPGGKALVVARSAAYTLAADRSLRRLRMVEEAVRRTGVRAGLVVADATAPPLRTADAVLLDVPCSGTGTLRRHPDARWRLSPRSVQDMADIQRRMLRAAAGVVRPGGLLVYATCSLEPEENRERIMEFLEQHEHFRLEAPPGRAEGVLEVLPQESGFDGSFAARLRRVA